MPSITLKAHYDGQTILLDEPYELPPNARLLVTVVAPTQDAERERWARLGGEGLARAYADSEPDYGPEDVRRP
jgi:hypothetical protein